MPPEEQIVRDPQGRFIPGIRASPSTEIKKGQKLSAETRAKMKGRIPWNKGKKLPQMSGENNPFFGKHHTDEVRRRCGEVNEGRIPTKRQLECLELARVPGHNKGRKPVYTFPKGEEHPHFVGKRGLKNMSCAAWFAYKNTIVERDGYTCQKCGSHKLLHVHHIIPLRHGGTDEPENLITVCPKCHKSLDLPLLIVDHIKAVITHG